MPNRLAGSVSPYLRSHSENPVDWQPWSADAFDEARRRDVPVLVSIGYSTCHWCHVMARESFSDPVLAAQLNERFVAIKVDREEHPDVDASYLAAAGAFTEHLGWPLNVFVTPDGRAFFAGTYWPPEAVAGHPAFRDVLTAVTDAWTSRRSEVDQNAAAIVAALQSSGVDAAGSAPVDGPALDALVRELVAQEDSLHGGFGGAPKFPVAPVIAFLLERGAAGNEAALALASRSIAALAGVVSPSDLTYAALRDRIGGGLFRYATRADWSEPHFERMLYDNAQLLESFVRLEVARPGLPGVRDVADGIGAFLLDVLERPGGGFASAQDSESTVDGSRVEGTYFELTAAERERQPPPPVDDKVLTGWNGLAMSALAIGGFRFGRSQWLHAARRAADFLLERHRLGAGTLARASVDGVISTAKATLEDYGMFAQGLLDLATGSGEVRYATAARELIDATIAAGGAQPFGVPGGADPVLAAQGLVLEVDPSEGAYPSGLSAMAGASHTLYLLTGFDRYREAAQRTIDLLAPLAVRRPMAFGATLTVASRLAAPITQLVVVAPETGSEVASVARAWSGSGALVCVLTAAQALEFAEAGFGLFAGRVRDAAYLCHHFVCSLPLTDPAALESALRA